MAIQSYINAFRKNEIPKSKSVVMCCRKESYICLKKEKGGNICFLNLEKITREGNKKNHPTKPIVITIYRKVLTQIDISIYIVTVMYCLNELLISISDSQLFHLK